MPRYLKRRRWLSWRVVPKLARLQLLDLTVHEDPDVAQMAAIELLDRLGRKTIEVELVRRGELVARHVHTRWWLDTIMPRANVRVWRVGVQSARKRRWARVATRVGAEMPAGVVAS